jgi:hypothetical protein
MYLDINTLIPIGTCLLMLGWTVTVVLWEYNTASKKL